MRVLEVALPAAGGGAANAWDMKRVGGGFLVQSPDARNVAAAELKVVTTKAPTPNNCRTCCSRGAWPSS